MTQASQLNGTTLATTSGLLTTTGAETVYDTTVAITYAIGGKAYVKATVADGVTPTTDTASGAAFAALADDTGSVVTWALNAAGTVSCHGGSVETLDSAGNFVVAPAFATLDLDTYCPFAYTVLKNTTGSAFTFGTTTWGTGTATTVNVLTMPSRPQES